METYAHESGHLTEEELHRLRRRLRSLTRSGRAFVTILLLTPQITGVCLMVAGGLASRVDSAFALLGLVGLFMFIFSCVSRFAVIARQSHVEVFGTVFRFSDETFALVHRARAVAGLPEAGEPGPLLLLSDDPDMAFPEAVGPGVVRDVAPAVELGLPLLYALSPEELECTAAYGLALMRGFRSTHLAEAEKLLSLEERLPWVFEPPLHRAPAKSVVGYRLYRPVLRRFLAWYRPRLAQRCAPLARATKLDSERRVVEAYGRSEWEATQRISQAVHTFLDEEYWPVVARGIGAGFDGHHPFREMEEPVGSCAERVRGSQKASAARVLLGDRVEEAAGLLDGRWRDQAELQLEFLARERAKAEDDVARIAAQEAEGGSSPHDAWTMAAGIERTEGPESALPLYRELVGDDEVGFKAEYRLGRGLLRTGDEAGLDHLRWVAFSSKEDGIAMAAAYEACDYLMRAGRELEAAPFHKRWLELREYMLPMHEERSQVLPNDRFMPHGLAEEVVARIQEELAEGPKLWRAYLVQKHVKIKPESPAYVLGLMVQHWVMVRVDHQSLFEAVWFAETQVELPEPCVVVGLYHDDWTKVIRRMRRVPGARIR